MQLMSDIWLITAAVDIDVVRDGRMIICMDINSNHMLVLTNHLMFMPFSIIDMCHKNVIGIYKHCAVIMA